MTKAEWIKFIEKLIADPDYLKHPELLKLLKMIRETLGREVEDYDGKKVNGSE